ncbi:flagellar hook-basal body complex protein FliE [Salirhabdus salicampi]|uniref:flagellar hook-basal body complex protein FliE n=1 Tax=Salirhabdus salicampi TaxID=476102 RepID=UPI0020C2F103|nr:flagellar hook-basal body complex protein FliE [Salirhabdus salicampi]MCP8616526.1 flagellar hook-basal body complex protein FliE [Salirhabdus salicampi]
MTNINQIKMQNPQLQYNQTTKATPFQAQQKFANTLKDALSKVNEAQNISDQKTIALAKGETLDLHDVMITSQKAGVLLRTTVEVQSKAIDAYKEMMRMQV